MDKKEDKKEFDELVEAVKEAVMKAEIVEIDKKLNSRLQVPVTWETLKQQKCDVLNPKPAEVNVATVSRLPVIPPDYPRLLASYHEKTLEYIVVNNGAEWAPYHDWHTVFPPNQPASRAITTTLEAEVEKLKAAGVPERPKQEHERRRQKAATNAGYRS